jgi:hypothetical protein
VGICVSSVAQVPLGFLLPGNILVLNPAAKGRQATEIWYWAAMIDIEFSIWLGSKSRWAHLTKTISMPAVPTVGEFLKFHNAEVGDYFAWQVSEATYREPGKIEVSTELLDNIDKCGYSFEEEQEFDVYFNSYNAEGWQCERGIHPNRRVRSTTDDP